MDSDTNISSLPPSLPSVGKLMDMHGEGVGGKVEGGYEPPVLDSV